VDDVYCPTGENDRPQSISQREGLTAVVTTVTIGVACRIKELEKEMNAGEAFEKNILTNSIHKPPALPVRIEKVLPLPGDHGSLI
jgi:hypothetical protein